MKTTITIRSIVAVALVLICNFMLAGTKTPSDSMCLRLKGKVAKTDISAGHTYTVEIIDNSTVIASKVVKAGKAFTFDVKRNGWYGLKIKNSDCVSKLISINTHVPGLEDGDAYLVDFEMEEPISLEESKYLDDDAIDFPLALISYEKDIDNFNYSEEYTKNIKKKLLDPLVDNNTGVAMENDSNLKNRQPLK